MEDVHLGGPGGIPEAVQLVAELPSRWRPPPPLAAAPKDGAATLGQVSGVDQR